MPIQRQFNPHEGILGRGFVDLEAVFTLGTGGAVSAVKGTGFATSDWTDNGTGDFTIALPGTGTLNIYQVTASITDDSGADLIASVKTVTEASGGSVNVTTWAMSGTPALADPASGSKLRLSVRLKQSAD